MSERDGTPEGTTGEGTPTSQSPVEPGVGDTESGMGPPAGVPGGFSDTAPPPPPRGGRSTKVTLIVAALVVAIAGAAVAVVLRSADRGATLEELVPAGAMAFGRAILSPTGDQRGHIEAILRKFPETSEGDVGEQIDRLLQKGFAEEGINYEEDIKPWLGAEVGFAVYRVSLGGGEPQIQAAVLIAVRDERAARAGLQKMMSATGDFEFAIRQGAAFISADKRSLSAALRVVNGEAEPLTTNQEYVAARDRVGADSVGLVWADASRLAAVVPPGFLPQIPGANLTGKTILGVRAGENRAEVVGLTFDQKQTIKTGSPKLLEGSPAEQLASLTLFDIAGVFEQGLEAFGLFMQIADPFATTSIGSFPQQSTPQFPGGFDPREQIEQALQQFLGLSLERDVLPWLHGEFSVVFGGFRSGPIPAVGVLIGSTDDAAAQRTIEGLRDRLGPLGASAGFDVTPAPGGFAVDFEQGVTVVVRRAAKRVVIATSDAYADELLDPGGETLGEDTVYRGVIGESSGDVGFQMFVRMDELTTLLETYLPPDDFDEAEPYLTPFQAIGMRAITEGDDATFRLVITFR